MGPRNSVASNGTTRMSHILLLLATEYIGPACTTVAGIHIYNMGPRNGTTRTSHILQYIGPACHTVAGIHIS